MFTENMSSWKCYGWVIIYICWKMWQWYSCFIRSANHFSWSDERTFSAKRTVTEPIASMKYDRMNEYDRDCFPDIIHYRFVKIENDWGHLHNQFLFINIFSSSKMNKKFFGQINIFITNKYNSIRENLFW